MLRKSPVLLFVAALCVMPLLVGSEQAHAASIITVDCTTDASALATALAGASNGDTLAIQGTCRGTFEVTHSLTLAGSAGATLDGQQAGTVLTVDTGTTVSVSNLTITGGSDSAVGGIRNGGSLTITNSTVSGNRVTVPQFVSGVAGIFNSGGSVTLVNSTVSGNSATANIQFTVAIGGIANFNFSGSGSVTLVDSTVSGNSANSPSLAYGGILSSAPASVAVLTNSTVSGNSANATGGASAFSIAAGGIANDGGNLSMTNVTLARNDATEPNGGFVPPAGGISNRDGGQLTLTNSLIAQQSDGPNCLLLSTTDDAGYNLDDGTSCGFGTANNSLSSTNPQLDPAGLQDNGGQTQTIALQPGSPAIDKIPAAVNGCGTTITTDQRGINRPQGTGCDIGAFEVMQQGADLAITKSATPSSVLSGNRLTYTLTLNNNGPQDATGVSVSDPLPDSVHFNSAIASQGTCTRSTTTNPQPKGGTLTCSLGNLANGASARVTIVVTTTTPGTLTNSATVSGNDQDPNPDNNSATATTTVIGT
jgi:uncharacterized repeat protein (TIGR01451 family)